MSQPYGSNGSSVEIKNKHRTGSSSVHVSSGGKSIAVQRAQKGYLGKAKGIMDELAKILRDCKIL